MNKEVHLRAADNIRILSMAMVEKARSGHPGGAMGGADFIHILFSEFLSFNPANPRWINRDRFFLDPGHMSPMLYSVLTLTGHFSTEELRSFRQWGSPTPGHPELDVTRGIENTSGPLGQGHAMAIGAAIAERFLVARFGELFAHKTYAFISDGGIQEEISQGAGRLAGYLGLNNLVMFYDSNDIQLSTETKDVTAEDTAMKYKSWGWKVITINGNDHDQIRKALKEAVSEKEKPVIIIGKTIMGKGLVDNEGKSFEKKISTHGMPVSQAGASFEKSLAGLGGNPDDHFMIFDEVKELYRKVLSEKRKAAEEWMKKKEKWATDNPELEKKLNKFYSGEIPEIDFSAIVQKENSATRAASATVLGVLASYVENMIVASADLSNSDKTDGFLKKTKAFTRGDFSGAFLQAGVAELTMAAVMNGMALHGGVIPACGTFFVFSDYMKPAVRLACLMELPVKYIWTHDAFRVGEDGPTHQPVEQEAQIRLMEQLKNHSGSNSMLVLRPADAAETTVSWKLALENKNTPTALLLSRQNISDLPAESGSRYNEALKAGKGAYVVADCQGTPDVILLASGSEVATLVEGAELLKKDGLKIRIVSAPSEGLFRNQSMEYRDSVIPSDVPVFGLTAGLPVTLQGLAGPNGRVWGVTSFGYSAPYKILDEKLGFTAANVYKQVKDFLDSFK
ncbi:MAG TPA: transketolase [Bacteroidales bacterium]|jgi:transketolase|nr:transketolase [Bacteroidales bacterium]HNY52025.1 transketolase [Bacteroidales bacterium]HOG55836.1 transketolase [Bacteroidales bacterium]HPV16126.1 transketolase [Bacteroidales bacterium]HPX42895.1 transketolase [Bacteroidales bacterium]